jgi:hypothetical protein
MRSLRLLKNGCNVRELNLIAQQRKSDMKLIFSQFLRGDFEGDKHQLFAFTFIFSSAEIKSTLEKLNLH